VTVPRTKRIFISDIHFGDDARYADPVPARRPRLEPESEGLRLKNFLDTQVLERQGEILDLVLLGDVFDTWVCPWDAVPPTYDSIFESKKNASIIGTLREIAQTDINLYYVNGNHDYDLGKADIESKIRGLQHRDHYVDEALGLYAEHGHRYTLFNKSYDHIADGLPLGYFITRFSEHMGKGLKKYVRGWKDLAAYVDDFYDFVRGTDNLFVTILEGLAEKARADKVVMSPTKKLSLDEIKEAYVPLGDEIPPFAAGAQLASERDLERHGDRISREKGYKVVVFGHTHEAKIDRDSYSTGDRIYVNSGSWCGKEAHCVLVEEDQALNSIRIRLLKINKEGQSLTVGTEMI
jgi:UDP-2,3-diacylglucosamine pyrophosphatase LpxH